MRSTLADVLALLDLEELEVDLFRGESPQEDRQRVFGGQVLGQALVAAGRTVESGEAHSLHAYFLRPGDPATPILYQVDRTRDGRSFTTRRVRAIQKGRTIFHLEASFQRLEVGPEHQDAMPDVPLPESLPTWREHMAGCLAAAAQRGRRFSHPVLGADADTWLAQARPIDQRFITPHDPFSSEQRPPRLEVWIRADGKLGDTWLEHQCVLAYASDLSLLDTALLPHGVVWGSERYQVASLDHAMWFHRSFRTDEWLLYVQESPAAAGARGFSMGKLFTRAGVLVASVVQEGLTRPLPRPASSRRPEP